MQDTLQLLVFLLEGQRYALHLDSVERVVRMVELTPLPSAPAIVLGVINVAGRVVPVLSVRRRLDLPEKQTGLDEHLVLASTGRRRVALVVDHVQDVVAVSKSAVSDSQGIVTGLEHISGVLKLDDGLVLINDLGRFLSLEEERELVQAMMEESDDVS